MMPCVSHSRRWLYNPSTESSSWSLGCVRRVAGDGVDERNLRARAVLLQIAERRSNRFSRKMSS